MSTPIQTFRRAIRRHEKRARRMGVPVDAMLRSLRTWRMLRPDGDPENLRGYARAHRLRASRLPCPRARRQARRIAFLLERAADTTERLRASSRSLTPET